MIKKIIVSCITLFSIGELSSKEISTYSPLEFVSNSLENGGKKFFLPKSLSPNKKYGIYAEFLNSIRYYIVRLELTKNKITSMSKVSEIFIYDDAYLSSHNIYWSPDSKFFVLFSSRGEAWFNTNTYSVWKHLPQKNNRNYFERLELSSNEKCEIQIYHDDKKMTCWRKVAFRMI